MKPSAFRIERLLAKVEAEVERRWLRVIIDGDDEAEAKTKALAEHVARHPEDVGRTVEDFNWILRTIVKTSRLGSGMVPSLCAPGAVPRLETGRSAF